MPKRRRRSRWLVWAAVAALACEYDHGTLELLVRVDPGRELATDLPAEVLVAFDSRGSGFVVFRVGFLCDPFAAPFVTTARFSHPMGADEPATAEAWLAPVDGATPLRCGPLSEPEPVFPAPAPRGADRTTASVQVLGGCGSGEARGAVLVLGAR